MRALLVIAATWWVSAAIGRIIIDRVLRQRSDELSLRSGEKFVFSSALGLGVLAYGVFALGLCGLLSAPFIGLWFGVVALLGAPGMRSMWRELRVHRGDEHTSVRIPAKVTPARGIAVMCLGTFAVLALIAVIACFQPPGAHAWDVLAYHLADPKVFLQRHQIVLLPTEHHSNFPFTMEMLFTIGLAFDGFAAANLFHLVMAAILSMAMVFFCDRFLSRLTGLLAVLLFLSTPIVLWELTIAYIDIGLSLYVFLAAYCIFLAGQSMAEMVGPSRRFRALNPSRILLIGGALMGFALGIKYLALLPLVMLLALALVRRLPIRGIVVFAGIACVIGCPWYIKNVIWMQNPVYPFAYSAFPHSRYWSEDRAQPYAEEQRSFGTSHELSHPIEAARNLAVTPWKLIASPELYTNKADFTFTSLIGGLYAGLLFSLVYVPTKRGPVRDLTVIVVFMFVAWFFVSQHIRYLLPALPFAAILSAYAAQYWMGLSTTALPSRSRIVNAFTAAVGGGAIAGQLVVLAWGISALPVSGRAASEALAAGVEPTALSISEVTTDLFQPAERDRHMRRLSSYGAAEWVNQHVPAGVGVVLYEDVHGFYLDRPYLWGNGEHSSYIPYGTMTSGHALTTWFRQHGIGYAIFNLNDGYAPGNPHKLLPEDLESVDATMRAWYTGNDKGWRRLVGENIQSGEWAIRFTHHGVAVLEIGALAP